MGRRRAEGLTEGSHPSGTTRRMTLTDLLVPTYRNMLQTLKGLLDKAEAQLGAGKAEALSVRESRPRHVPARHPDPLRRGPGVRRPHAALGDPPPPAMEDTLNEGRNAGEHPGPWPKPEPASTRPWRTSTPSAPTRSIPRSPASRLVLDLRHGPDLRPHQASNSPATGRSANSTSTSWPPTRS